MPQLVPFHHQLITRPPLVLSLLVILICCFSAVTSQNLICRRIPKLNQQQVTLCERYPDILPIIRSGIQLALAQCEQFFASHQSVHHAWNCSSFIQNSTNRLYVDISHPEVTGTKEASLAHAIFSAGITYALSEACTRSNFSYCSCGQPSEVDLAEDLGYEKRKRDLTRHNWKWQGCMINVEFGAEMARRFLDSHEQTHMTPYSLVNLHNNFVGRKVVKDGATRCQCHGYSGSCSMKTCWREANEFQMAAQGLFERYTAAKEVSFGWLLKAYKSKFLAAAEKGNQRTAKSVGSTRSRKNKDNPPTKLDWLSQLEARIGTSTQLELNQPNFRRNPEPNVIVRRRDLVFVKQSVNFCAASTQKRVTCQLATKGDANWPAINSCGTVCCGRGYRTRMYLKTEKCDCSFRFCCGVQCRSQCQRNVTQYECL